MRKVYFTDLGRIEYGKAWQMQEALMQEGLQAKAAWNSKPETERTGSPYIESHLFFCEHPHVYTLGKSGHMENLLISESRMKELDVTFYKTNRGGDITYHGPGQVVGYPVLDLEQFFTDLGRYMRSLEEVIIRTMAYYGLKGDRLQGAPGVWLESDDAQHARKICAMGVRCSRWITIHGFAFNVNADLSYFDNIVPCGIDDKSVTSLEKELGRKVDMEEVEELLKKEFATIFETEILPAPVKESIYL